MACRSSQRRSLIRQICYAVIFSSSCVLGLIGCGGDSTSPPANLALTTTSLHEGQTNQPYSASVGGSGGTLPYLWSVTPALPAGLSFNTQSGAITGTPGTLGTTSHTFTLADSSIPPQTIEQSLSLTIKSPVSIPMPWGLPAGNIGAVYSQPIQTVGGFGPMTFYIINVIPGTRGLPPGLNLDLTTGIISGIPIGPAGTFDFTIAVQDGPGAANAVLGMLIDPSSPPQITTSSLPTGTLSVLYNQPLQAAAGIGPLTWSISGGSLPPGLTFGPPSTGPRVIISGTPTTQGTFNFTVTVTDTVRQVDTRALSITISLPAPPTMTTTTLPAGSIGQTYNQPVMATGTGPLTWSISAGALPPGLNLNATTGTITGAPTATGTFPFTVCVADTFGQNDTQPSSILVSTQ